VFKKAIDIKKKDMRTILQHSLALVGSAGGKPYLARKDRKETKRIHSKPKNSTRNRRGTSYLAERMMKSQLTQ